MFNFFLTAFGLLRAHLARSDSQSEDRIPFLLPMGTAGDIMKACILTARPSEDHWN